MPNHDPPTTTSQGVDPARTVGDIALDYGLPVLRIAKESVTGLGIIGLEAGMSGALKIGEMIKTMKDNKKDLANLCKHLKELEKDFDKATLSTSAGELVPRLSQASKQLATIITDCKTLQKSHGIVRFFQGARFAAQIADIKQSIRDMIQNFVFFGSVSIENIVGQMATRLEEFVVSTHVDRLIRAPARYNADNTPSECMEGTRVDLVNDLVDHAAGVSQSSQVTIVYGIPGSGKSTIAKTVAIQLAKRGLLAASFFFSRNHGTRRELKLVFSTIAFQLAQFSKEYGQLLSDILKNDPDIIHEAPKDHLDKLIIHPLSQLPPPTNGKPWAIALDALDECGADRGYDLLQLLTSRLEKFPKYIRFFLTGRPEDPILSAFNETTIEPVTYKHTLDTTLEGAISGDIRHYVEQSLGGEWPGRHGWVAKDKDLNALVTRARGLFIFAATAVRYIRDQALQQDPQVSMEFVLGGVNASGPRLLDQLYFKIVNDAVPAGNATFIGRYQRVLGSVVHLQEPLSAGAIAELLNMAPGDVSRVVGLLSSVLLVSEGAVRIAHLSFREYVTGAIRIDRKDLSFDDPSCHTDLAASSIILMNKKLHQNMCRLDTIDTYAPNSDVPGLSELVSRNIPPALRYACLYWALHFQPTNDVGLDELETWLRTNVLFWVEALSLCEELSRGIPLIRAAQNWYKYHPSRVDFARCTTLLSDTRRFIAAFFPVISLSAGHTYYSALPFTPSSSKLSHMYNHLTGQSVRVVKGVEPMWSPLQWSVNTGNVVHGVAFSPSREWIASAYGNEIEVRSSETGKLLSTLEGHTDTVCTVTFSPDGTRIASGSYDGTIRIWSSETGQSLSTLEGHTGRVSTITFSPDGTSLVSGSGDTTIRIWSPKTGELLLTLEGHK